jgi:hypothetical protein
VPFIRFWSIERGTPNSNPAFFWDMPFATAFKALWTSSSV